VSCLEQVKEELGVMERQLATYQEQAKQWEKLRQQLCTRIAQLEGKVCRESSGRVEKMSAQATQTEGGLCRAGEIGIGE